MEIFQNTLLKIVVRQGADADRKKVLLTAGEPAYTTDTKRFFVGDGVLSGGNVTGNLFKGDFTGGNPLVVEPAEIGDLAYDTDSRRLYRLKNTNTGLLTSWSQIGGVYVSGDNYILVDNDNELRLAPLSSNSVASDLLQLPIILSSGRIGLAALSANYISSDAVKGPIIVDTGRITLSAKIPFQTVSTNTVFVSGGLKAYVDGVDVTGTPVNTLSSNLVITSNQLFIKYNGLSGDSVAYTRGVSVNRLSAGDYLFTYGTLSTSNIIPVVQIYGIDFLQSQARVISANLSACNVYVLSSNGFKTDANVYLSITY